jgi:hypothetical protein
MDFNLISTMVQSVMGVVSIQAILLVGGAKKLREDLHHEAIEVYFG